MSVFLLVYLLQSNMVYAANEDRHVWEVEEVSFHNVPIYSHDFNVWHHFIQKRKECNVVNKVKTEVRYCSVHNHFETKVTSEEVIHSYEH